MDQYVLRARNVRMARVRGRQMQKLLTEAQRAHNRVNDESHPGLEDAIDQVTDALATVESIIEEVDS